jgi:hypothetical protein
VALHNLASDDEYRAALQRELGQVGLTREQKAAIVEELESLGKRTAVENRAGIETAGVAPGTGPADADRTAGRHADDPTGH